MGGTLGDGLLALILDGSHHVALQRFSVEWLDVVEYTVVQQVDVECAQCILVVAEEGGVLWHELIDTPSDGVELHAVSHIVAHQVVVEIDCAFVQWHNVWHSVNTVLKRIFLLSLQVEQVRGIAHEHWLSKYIACRSLAACSNPDFHRIRMVVYVLCQIE